MLIGIAILAVLSLRRAAHPRAIACLMQEAKILRERPAPSHALGRPTRDVTRPAHGDVHYLNGQYLLIMFLI